MILSITMLICSAAVLGIYIWHGQWMAIGVALLAGGCGRLMFGLVELLLFPLTKLMLYFAQRGKRRLSRDPCGIDLIMPLPAPAKGCVASA